MHTYIHIIGVQKGDDREKGAENLFEEKMTEFKALYSNKSLF